MLCVCQCVKAHVCMLMKDSVSFAHFISLFSLSIYPYFIVSLSLLFLPPSLSRGNFPPILRISRVTLNRRENADPSSVEIIVEPHHSILPEPTGTLPDDIPVSAPSTHLQLLSSIEDLVTAYQSSVLLLPISAPNSPASPQPTFSTFKP